MAPKLEVRRLHMAAALSAVVFACGAVGFVQPGALLAAPERVSAARSAQPALSGPRFRQQGLAPFMGALCLSALVVATKARLTTRHAVPNAKIIPVVNLEGQKIGEEELQLRTFSSETANYCVHQAHTIYKYQQLPHTVYLKRRSDMKKGKKLWKNKGVGKARMGSIYSPLWGKAATNKNKHGLDDRKKMKLPRLFHCKAISTVLQSKWRCMKIVDGLEDIKEPRYYDLVDMIRGWTGIEPGIKQTLMISRSGYGEEHWRWCVPTWKSLESPIYMAGRLIDNFSMRRPRDMDPESDGLHQALLGRRVIISRQAFFDLKAKFDAHDGWAFKSPKDILIEQMQDLVKEYPYDREAEFEAAREVPKRLAQREFWAKKIREKEAELALKGGS
mmetsp:Transcript_45117/g.84196  ORF Transcript_45117/g.84196 Transcript_45117/m.84196 type:complete len:388 (+) Transcript_45117:1-1164(+)